MKRIYVINLNQKRIFLIVGVFLIILGTSLWSGIKIGRSYNINFELDEKFNVSDNETKNVIRQNPLGIGDPLESGYIPVQNKEGNVSLLNVERQGRMTKPIPPINLPDLTSKDRLNIKTKDPMARRAVSNIPARSLPSPGSKKQKVSSQKAFYTIQVGAFRHEKDAKALVSRLKKQNLKSYIDRGVKYYYVRMGKANSKERLLSQKSRVERAVNVKTLILKTGK